MDKDSSNWENVARTSIERDRDNRNNNENNDSLSSNDQEHYRNVNEGTEQLED